MFLQSSNEIPESRVSVGDLAVVQVTLVDLRVWRGRFVRIVRIVEVPPYEAGTRRVRVQPCLCALHDLHAAAFDPAPARSRLRVLRKVVVEIKSTVQSRRQGFAIENHRAN